MRGRMKKDENVFKWIITMKKKKEGRDRQTTKEVEEEEVDESRGCVGVLEEKADGREWGRKEAGCSQMALMTNDIPCLPVLSPQHHDLSSPLLTFFIALSNHPDRMIFSNSPSLGARQK